MLAANTADKPTHGSTSVVSSSSRTPGLVGPPATAAGQGPVIVMKTVKFLATLSREPDRQMGIVNVFESGVMAFHWVSSAQHSVGGFQGPILTREMV